MTPFEPDPKNSLGDLGSLLCSSDPHDWPMQPETDIDRSAKCGRCDIGRLADCITIVGNFAGQAETANRAGKRLPDNDVAIFQRCSDSASWPRDDRDAGVMWVEGARKHIAFAAFQIASNCTSISGFIAPVAKDCVDALVSCVVAGRVRQCVRPTRLFPPRVLGRARDLTDVVQSPARPA